MEELEDPTEKLREKIHEEAEGKAGWSFYVALSTAIMAVFAAISGLIGGDHANEAMMEQIKASNQWAYYQAKSIKSEIATVGHRVEASGHDTLWNQKVAKYEADKEVIRKNADESEKASAVHLQKHKIIARATTLFQIAIAIAAISMLSRKRFLWIISIALGVAGIGFLLQGLLA